MTSPRPRGRLEAVTEGAPVTPLELFLDLVFVYAFTQVTEVLGSTPEIRGLVRGLLLLALLWWCWCCFAWLGNVVQADEGVARLAIFGVMAAMFVAALTISAIARLVTYAATCGGLLLFRNRADAPHAQFHLPAGKLIAALSLVLIVWLLANSTGQEALTAAVVGTVGLLIFFSYRFYSRPS